jgi:hypothetical protein
LHQGARSLHVAGEATYVVPPLARAQAEHAIALIIQLDTPGGLERSMRSIVQRMLNAEIPVIVYVGPTGARAASAGVFITLAGHVAAKRFEQKQGVLRAQFVLFQHHAIVRLTDEGERRQAVRGYPWRYESCQLAPVTLVTTTLSWVGSDTFRDFVNGTLLAAN